MKAAWLIVFAATLVCGTPIPPSADSKEIYARVRGIDDEVLVAKKGLCRKGEQSLRRIVDISRFSRANGSASVRGTNFAINGDGRGRDRGTIFNVNAKRRKRSSTIETVDDVVRGDHDNVVDINKGRWGERDTEVKFIDNRTKGSRETTIDINKGRGDRNPNIDINGHESKRESGRNNRGLKHGEEGRVVAHGINRDVDDIINRDLNQVGQGEFNRDEERRGIARGIDRDIESVVNRDLNQAGHGEFNSVLSRAEIGQDNARVELNRGFDRNLDRGFGLSRF